MIFRCKNCGANAVYSPEKNAMYCPYCDSIDSEEPAEGEGMQVCINCGGELDAGDYKSAVKCEHCGSYVIFEERTRGEYAPHLILPFKISRSSAQEMLVKEFGKKAFLPDDFLSEAKMSEMEGMYVPYYMFDFDCEYMFQGNGHVVRTWRSGDTEYTETSVFRVIRDMTVSFDKVPVDASVSMSDEIMDILEPFDYGALIAFREKYMSGFLAEKYSISATQLEPRAKGKARDDAKALMERTFERYATVVDRQEQVNMQTTAEHYALLPVWSYSYTYRGKVYPFKINGQTGKMSGKAPISIPKVVAYGATVFFGTVAIGNLINMILGVF